MLNLQVLTVLTPFLLYPVGNRRIMFDPFTGPGTRPSHVRISFSTLPAEKLHRALTKAKIPATESHVFRAGVRRTAFYALDSFPKVARDSL
jgi:hypothetical protein